MGLREEKKERTRREILETAEALFREQGYAETPMRSVAEAVGLSIQTLYNYFPSKEGILTGLHAERMQRMAEAVGHLQRSFLEDPEAEGTGVERFLHMIRWGLRALADDRDFWRLVFLHTHAVRGGALTPEGEKAARDLVKPQEDNNVALDAMFESMQKAGELRSEVRPREVTELYVLMWSDRVARWLASDDTDVRTLEARVIGSLEILFRGLRA